MINLIGGVKGETSKSFICNCLVHYFCKYREAVVCLIDSDQDNPGVSKIYKGLL